MTSHTLTVQTHPASLDSPTPANGSQTDGAPVQLGTALSYTATNGTFYIFDMWTVDVGGLQTALDNAYSPTAILTMPAATTTVTANYVAVPDIATLLTNILADLDIIAKAV